MKQTATTLLKATKRGVLTAIFTFACLYSFADDGSGASDSKRSVLVGANGHLGFLLNHHNNVRGLNEQRPFAAELFVGRSTDGSERWHAAFNYPDYGVSYVLYSMGSPSHLGLGHGLAPFMNFYLLDRNSTVNINAKVGAGIVYVEKTFDRITNYKNGSISTHINALINLQASMSVHLSSQLTGNLGFSLIHMSNGSYRKPNAGLNFVNVFAGATYSLSEQKRLPKLPQEPFAKSWEYRLFLSGGLKEISPVGGSKYLQTGLSFEASRQHLSSTRFGATMDVFYSFSDYPSLVDEGADVTRLQATKLGLTAGYELMFGRLSANFQAGMYLYAKNDTHGRMYQRLALRYAATSRLKVHVGLKTQLGMADYVEFGLGYRIR